MKSPLTPIAACTALIATCAAAIDPPFEQPRSLAFLNQRGGISIDQPLRKNNQWMLPVNCNVSGIKAITTQPNVIHSGLAWSKSVARIEDERILLTVMTGVQGSRAPSAICGPAPLKRLYHERYEVLYLDPDGTTHPLGTICTGDC
jgi:hypothetical protein